MKKVSSYCCGVHRHSNKRGEQVPSGKKRNPLFQMSFNSKVQGFNFKTGFKEALGTWHFLTFGA
jgi:hypothetical protein